MGEDVPYGTAVRLLERATGLPSWEGARSPAWWVTLQLGAVCAHIHMAWCCSRTGLLSMHHSYCHAISARVRSLHWVLLSPNGDPHSVCRH